MKSKLLLLLFATGLLTACDPALNLVIETSNKPNVFVTIYCNRDISSRFATDTSNKIVHVPNDSLGNKITYWYGIGGWSPENLSVLTQKIDSVIINNSNSRLILTDKESINTYFLKNLSGFANSILTIKAE